MNYERGGVFAEKQEALPHARFILRAVKSKRLSLEAGHDVYVDKPHIEILKQGGDVNQFAVNDEFKSRYPEKWSAFEAGLQEPQVGLPLEEWPGCSRAECENLKSVNLFTVEDVAGAADIAMDSYGIGGREMKNKAIKYLEASKDTGTVIAKLADVEKKMDAMVSRNEELEGIIRTLKVQQDAGEIEEKRKPGRPKKE